MKITLRQIYVFLFLLGVFFIPFNSWEGIEFMGEFKRESSAIFFLLAFLFLVLEVVFKRKIKFQKDNIVTLLVLFITWILITFLFNFPTILDSLYKKTSGLNRFLRQFFSLLISCGVFFSVYYYSIKTLETKDVLRKIRKILLYSLIVVCIYAFFEIIYIFSGFYPAYQILRLFDYFPFTEFDMQQNGRISSVAWESPALGTYLITISGWMFSYIITHKKIYKYIPLLFVLILTYYSGSRTALIVIVIQLIVFLFVYLNRKQLINLFSIFGIATLLLTISIFLTKPQDILFDLNKKIESLDFRGNLKKNISNQSRFGIQYANLMVFKEHPITGVGFGQQGYHAINHYPIWAKKDNWEFKEMYLNKNEPSFPPGYNLYIRLLAETGIIGFFIFLTLFSTLFKRSYKLVKKNKGDINTLGIILLVSFTGYALDFMQIDSVRIYGFWICIAILLTLQFKKNDTDSAVG